MMTEMDLKLIIFRRVLRYWIASHNTGFPLLEDGLTEKLATYDGDRLVLKNCFKRCSNPLLVVNEDCIRSYLTYDMRDVMNAFIPAVLDDIKKEFYDLQNRLNNINAKAATLQCKTNWDIADEFRWNQLYMEYTKTREELEKLSILLRWFNYGLPHFKNASMHGLDFWVKFGY